MGGYLTLLQCVTDDAYVETTPRASRWLTTKVHMKGIKGVSYRAHLDALTITNISWLPYKRVVRQFGYIQTIPSPLVTASLSYEEIDERWMHFGDHLAPVGEICVVSGQVTADYMEWFLQISHLLVTSTQEGDEPRQLAALDVDAYVEPHVLEVPVAADLPRHSVVACEGCEAIAERLKRVLNLRMVTAGTELHDIMEDFLRITKGEASNGSLRA
ncbi:uncharacterized protein LOC114398766 [Glycine soja]|nr:uncharacterized protein LOC114398766 [Glycine soja]